MVTPRILDRKLLRDLAHARGLLIAVLAVLTVGIACFVAMRSSYFNLQSALDRYYARCHLADVWIDLKKAPVSEVHDRLDLPGVAAVVPRLSFLVTVDLDGVDRPLSGQVISLPPSPVGLHDLIITHGDAPAPDAENELIVIQQFAEARGLVPGDEIHLILNNRRQPFRITGIALSAEFVYLMSPGSIVPGAEYFGVFYLPERAMREVFDFDGACNSVLLRLDPALTHASPALLDELERVLNPFGVFRVAPRREHASHWFITDELRQLNTTGLILPGVVLAVAVLLLNILLTRLIEQQRTIIGIFKAFGYTNGEVRRHYLKFALVIGTLGGLLGSALGLALAAWLTIIYRRYYVFPDLTNGFFIEVLLTGFALALLTGSFGAWRGVALAVGLQPAEAMRPKPPVIGRRIPLERITFLWRRLDFTWRMSLRGLARARARTTAGLIAAALAGAIMFTALGLRDAIHHMVDFQFRQVLRADANLVLADEQPAGVLREIRHLPGVEHVEPIFEVPCTFVHEWRRKKGAITGIQPEARLTKPRDARGRAVSIPETGLVMSRALADLLALRLGDDVTIEPVRGRRESFTMPLMAITDSSLGLAAYADFHALNRAMGEEDSVSAVQIATSRAPRDERELARAVKGTPAVRTINLIREQKEEFERLLGVTNISVGILILFAGVIMLGGLVTNSLITLSERQREVATFRTLGLHEHEISRMFLRDGLLVNISGALIGLPIGYGLLALTAWSFQTEALRIPVVVEPRSWLFIPLLALGFTLIAHLAARRTIQRLPWREVLNVGD